MGCEATADGVRRSDSLSLAQIVKSETGESGRFCRIVEAEENGAEKSVEAQCQARQVSPAIAILLEQRGQSAVSREKDKAKSTGQTAAKWETTEAPSVSGEKLANVDFAKNQSEGSNVIGLCLKVCVLKCVSPFLVFLSQVALTRPFL